MASAALHVGKKLLVSNNRAHVIETVHAGCVFREWVLRIDHLL
jgi:hypothetical protein